MNKVISRSAHNNIVFELISVEHDVVSISFFMSKFLRDVCYVCKTVNRIPTVEIDNSMALILSGLRAFYCEDMFAFLRRSHRILTREASKGEMEKCNPHVCSAHVLNAIKKKSLKRGYSPFCACASFVYVFVFIYINYVK
jgi:hypothetical protein